MIELIPEDLDFKQSAAYASTKSLIDAAKAIETTNFERAKNGQYSGPNQRSIVGIIMDSFGWDGGTDGIAKSPEEAAQLRKTRWHKDAADLHHYRQDIIFALSGYIVLRLDKLDRENKTNQEIADWLRRMAE
jgi:hypothetical protein